MPNEQRVQDNNSKSNPKCRIPLRLSAGPPLSKNTKPIEKNRPEIISLYHSSEKSNNKSRPSDQTNVRPKSANRATDLKSARFERGPDALNKKPPFTVPKRSINEKSPKDRSNRPIIILPEKHVRKRIAKLAMTPKSTARSVVYVRALKKTFYSKSPAPTLPDQDTIRKCEDYELQEDFSDVGQMYDSNETESITSPSEKLLQLKLNWKERKSQFENLKHELNERQSRIMHVYASLRDTQEQLCILGQNTTAELVDDLQIMNVAQMSPQQLLQLCADTQGTAKEEKQDLAKNYLNIDINKLNKIPSKLFSTCKQALVKQKEMIDFDNLKNQEKEFSKKRLTNKINEFNAENEMLDSTLRTVKTECLDDLNNIIDVVRSCVNETIKVSLQKEELTCELSELNSQNSDLRKQIHNSEQLKSQQNKTRMEELENALKEEKIKSAILKERLSRTDGQVKINENRAMRSEAALDQARGKVRHLERTTHHLRQQNERIQKEYDEQLCKLNETIKESSNHLEEIANAKEKLQAEKEDLKNRLSELGNYYNESITNLEGEIKNNVAKIIETEKNYNGEIDENKNLKKIVESQCAQLIETELRLKDSAKLLEETQSKLADALNELTKRETVKNKLENANSEIEKYKIQITKLSNTIEEMQQTIKTFCMSEEQMKNNMNKKENYIIDLENRLQQFEQDTKESEAKMLFYEEQLLALKEQIVKLQVNLGEFENINKLHDLINEKDNKLSEMSNLNKELSAALQKQNADVDCYKKTIIEQEHCIKERGAIIDVLCEKEKEQAKKIQQALLNKNWNIGLEVEPNINKQLIKKDDHVKQLVADLETKSKQICQLEKVIISLDDQTRKALAQGKQYQKKIGILEKVIAEYESIGNGAIQTPTQNLDSLIKILENEIESPVGQSNSSKKHNEYSNKKNIKGQSRHSGRVPENMFYDKNIFYESYPNCSPRKENFNCNWYLTETEMYNLTPEDITSSTNKSFRTRKNNGDILSKELCKDKLT